MQAISLDADKDEDEVWDIMNVLKYSGGGPMQGK